MSNERKSRILAKIRQNEKNTEQVKKEKEFLSKQIMEENMEKRLERENNIKRVAQMKENYRMETLSEIMRKNEKVEQYKKQKEMISEQKRLIADEISKKKQEFSGRFETIFSKKSIDERTIRTIQEMFPDNQEINNLLNNFKTMNSNNNSTTNSNSMYKKKRQSKIENTKYTLSTANFDKSISGYSVNEGNTRPRKAYSSKSRPVTQNNEATTKTAMKESTTTSFIMTSNDPKKNEIIDKKVKEYRLKMNRELLDFLAKEKQKEANRERQLEEYEINDPKRSQLEKKFGEERAKASISISKKNEEIETKIKDYERQLRFGA